MKHTKGKWEYNMGSEWPFTQYIHSNECGVIAKLEMAHYSTKDKTIQDIIKRDERNLDVLKDAKLISKAPEMLEALKDELEFLDIVYLAINYPGARHLEYVRHDINARKKQIKSIIEELK